MKRFYISSHHGPSGISKYAKDFYNLVLKDMGYVHIDSSAHYSEIFSAVSSRDHVHIEIGIFQKKEIEILMRMIKAKYKHIAVTLHDAPLIKYPFHDFKLPLLNKASRFYDLHWDNFSSLIPYVSKIQRIYVLSRKGVSAVRSKYHTGNVFYLPHIVNLDEIVKPEVINKHFIFFGFIGPNKGIEYSLQLHEALLNSGEKDVQFYVAGTALGSQRKYYEALKEKYVQNVHYLGYVDEDVLTEVFNKCSFALLPFKEYGFFHPFSGSILHSIKKGKLVFTNKVNAVPELIKDGETGFYLSGQLNRDVALIKTVFASGDAVKQVISNAQEYLKHHHSETAVRSSFLSEGRGMKIIY
jgi:glycosyltransferase involved in cell wall biosynthesis